jgi:hypothetical protein
MWSLFASKSRLVAAWFPNLGTELFAIVIAVALLDGAVKRDQVRRRKPIREVTSHSLVGALRPLVFEALVTNKFDANVEPPSTLRQLFDAWTRFIDQYRYKARLQYGSPQSTVMGLRRFGNGRRSFEPSSTSLTPTFRS